VFPSGRVWALEESTLSEDASVVLGLDLANMADGEMNSLCSEAQCMVPDQERMNESMSSSNFNAKISGLAPSLSL
jgi:hypothetical protein